MKTKFTLCILSFIFMGSVYAQVPNGSTARDFTATDLDGNTHSLYADYLDNGKAVILDLSAAWCAPCWTYHEDGLLKDTYMADGPDGTDELQVLFIESEATNTEAQLRGTTTANTRAGFTQGDWVTGTPYPIIDDASIAPLFGLSFYPTVMIIRPDGKTLQSYDSNFPLTSDFMSYAAKNKAINDIMISGNVNDGNESGCSEVSPSVNVINMGTTEVTSFRVEMRNMNGDVLNFMDWTGTLGVFETTNVALPTFELPSVVNDIEMVLLNPNGMTDEVDFLSSEMLEYKLISKDATFIDETFEDQTMDFGSPNNFILSNVDVERVYALNSNAYAPPLAQAVGGYGESDFSIIVVYANWSSQNTSGSRSIISSTNLDLTDVTNAALIFDRSAAQLLGGSPVGMNISMREGCDGIWTEVYSKSGADLATVPDLATFYAPAVDSWVTDTVDISAFDGLSDVHLQLTFVTSPSGGNALYLDNIHTESLLSAVEEVEALESLVVYPNPANNFLNVDFNLDSNEDLMVELTNTLGQRVLSLGQESYTAGNHQIQQDVSNVPTGVYFVSIRNKNQVSVHKVSITH